MKNVTSENNAGLSVQHLCTLRVKCKRVIYLWGSPQKRSSTDIEGKRGKGLDQTNVSNTLYKDSEQSGVVKTGEARKTAKLRTLQLYFSAYALNQLLLLTETRRQGWCFFLTTPTRFWLGCRQEIQGPRHAPTSSNLQQTHGREYRKWHVWRNESAPLSGSSSGLRVEDAHPSAPHPLFPLILIKEAGEWMSRKPVFF